MTGDQKIVVDGYNVIWADEVLRRLAIKDMERARRRLLSRIAAYLEGRSLEITVVFDGKGGVGDEETVIPGKLRAVFSGSRETADERIVRMVADSGNPKSYLVVSSDRAHVRPAVSALGCRSLGAASFLERIRPKWRRGGEAGSGGGSPHGEGKPDPEASDRDFWLERFEAGSDEET